MTSSNPVLRESVFSPAAADAKTMTMDGVVQKTGLLLFLCLCTFLTAWFMPAYRMPFIVGGAVGGLIVGLVGAFVPRWSPGLAPAYALFEGLFLGAISLTFEKYYPKIVIQAVVLTFGCLATMLFLYQARIIKVTQGLRTAVFAATGAIALVYLIGFVMSFFGSGIPYIHESGPIGICFSLFVVGLASFNLLLDFDFVEQGVNNGAPKYMEWYAGFSLLVTLVWLYLEILRLLAKLRGRD
ncbi:MAG: Bax inhibitor-1/YccA family protein [Verrucomicrobiota bacterium]